MNKLQLVKSESFGTVQCDIYRSDNDSFMTREQIGMALEYSDPRDAIANLHARHKQRLDQFSVTLNLRATDGKSYATTVYNRKGVMEICRWSQQPKADEFVDWAWDVMDDVISGKARIVVNDLGNDKLLRAQAMLMNAQTRQAKFLAQLAQKFQLSQEASELVTAQAVEVCTGKPFTYRPELSEGKHYTATEIASEAGCSSMRVGMAANAHGLKTPEFGKYILEQKKYSKGQTDAFIYNEKGREKLLSILKEEGHAPRLAV